MTESSPEEIIPAAEQKNSRQENRQAADAIVQTIYHALMIYLEPMVEETYTLRNNGKSTIRVLLGRNRPGINIVSDGKTYWVTGLSGAMVKNYNQAIQLALKEKNLMQNPEE